MKKTFKASPKAVTAAIELDERWAFEFPDKEFEVWGYNGYVKCTLEDEKVVDPNEVEYTIAMECSESFWDLEQWLLRGIEEYMDGLTDGSDYGFFAIVERKTPKGFYSEDDMYVYTATVNVYSVERDWFGELSYENR